MNEGGKGGGGPKGGIYSGFLGIRVPSCSPWVGKWVGRLICEGISRMDELRGVYPKETRPLFVYVQCDAIVRVEKGWPLGEKSG